MFSGKILSISTGVHTCWPRCWEMTGMQSKAWVRLPGEGSSLGFIFYRVTNAGEERRSESLGLLSFLLTLANRFRRNAAGQSWRLSSNIWNRNVLISFSLCILQQFLKNQMAEPKQRTCPLPKMHAQSGRNMWGFIQHPPRASSAAWENSALPSVLSPAFCQTSVWEMSLCSLAFAMSYLGRLLHWAYF